MCQGNGKLFQTFLQYLQLEIRTNNKRVEMEDDEICTGYDEDSGRIHCRTVKSQRCLHEQKAKYAAREYAAWDAVAKHCNEKEINCRYRWKNLRKQYNRCYEKLGQTSNANLYPYLTCMMPQLHVTQETHKSLANKRKRRRITSDSSTSSCDDILEKSFEQNTKIETITDEPINVIQHEDIKQEGSDKRAVELERKDMKEVCNSQESSGQNADGLGESKTPQHFMDVDIAADSRDDNCFDKVLKTNITRPEMKCMAAYPVILTHISTAHDANALQQGTHAGIATFSKAESDLKNQKLLSGPAESVGKLISVGTQCDPPIPITACGPTDKFLEFLKSTMGIMNFRQNVNFKWRVYKALMDVLDDCQNFPNQSEIVKTTSAPMADIQKTDPNELTLVRNFVSHMKGAKAKLEFREPDDKNSLESPIELPTTSKLAAASCISTTPTQAEPTAAASGVSTSSMKADLNVGKEAISSGLTFNAFPKLNPFLVPQKDNATIFSPAAFNSTDALPKARHSLPNAYHFLPTEFHSLPKVHNFMPKAIEIASSSGSTILTSKADIATHQYLLQQNILSSTSLLATTSHSAGVQSSNANAIPQLKAFTSNSNLPSVAPPAQQSNCGLKPVFKIRSKGGKTFTSSRNLSSNINRMGKVTDRISILRPVGSYVGNKANVPVNVKVESVRSRIGALRGNGTAVSDPLCGASPTRNRPKTIQYRLTKPPN